MKIDMFSHILPQGYRKAFLKRLLPGAGLGDLSSNASGLFDIDVRLSSMDEYPDVIQALTVAVPPLETRYVSPKNAIELAQLANNEMAEMVAKDPKKFMTAAACLPMNDIDAAIKEAERAITQLHFRGVQIFTNINGEPLDTPKFKPLYEMMAKHDLPIWIHPWGQPKSPSGSLSTNPIRGFGWPVETTYAMECLVQTGIFEDYPYVKFITHHCGGMLPFFEKRIKMGGTRGKLDDFRKFYADTALYGNTAALMCGYAFFGADHLLFGTDMPFSSGDGSGYTRETILSIEHMDIPQTEKDKIFHGNARRILKL